MILNPKMLAQFNYEVSRLAIYPDGAIETLDAILRLNEKKMSSVLTLAAGVVVQVNLVWPGEMEAQTQMEIDHIAERMESGVLTPNDLVALCAAYRALEKVYPEWESR